MSNVLYVAHRGSKIRNHVENTKGAFIDGCLLGYDVLECDVRVTKDGKYIIFHDDTLTRLTSNSNKQFDLNVNQEKWQTINDIELSELYRGTLKQGDTICTLDEYLDVCKKYAVRPIIELKWTNGIYSSNDNPDNHNFDNIDGLIDKIIAYGLYDKAIVMTSMRGCLEYVRLKHLDIELQWLCNVHTKEYLTWCSKWNIGIDVEYTYCDEEIVNFAHESNLKVNIWTLDDEELLQKYLDMGVDMITTNLIRKR